MSSDAWLVAAGAVPPLLIALAQVWAQQRSARDARAHEAAMAAAERDSAAERERDAHRAAMLYDLQVAVQRCTRAAGAAHHADVIHHRKTGQPYGSAPMPDGWSEEQMEATTAVHLAAARVGDPTIAAIARQVAEQASAVGSAKTELEGDDLLLEMMVDVREFSERIADRLAELPPPSTTVPPLLDDFIARPDRRKMQAPAKPWIARADDQ